MLVLDSPRVYWLGLINVAPCHSELAEPGQSSSLSSLLHPLLVVVLLVLCTHRDGTNKMMNDNPWTVEWIV